MQLDWKRYLEQLIGGLFENGSFFERILQRILHYKENKMYSLTFAKIFFTEKLIMHISFYYILLNCAKF